MPTRLLSTLLLTAALSACNEKPQNFYQSERSVQEREQTARVDRQRQRTIGENEADRTHNEGMLR